MSRGIMRAISGCLLGFFFFFLITIVFGSLADDGVIADAWNAMLDYIPFGGFLGQLAVSLYTSAFSLGNSGTKYVLSSSGMTFMEFLSDTGTAVLCGVIFEAVNNFFQVLFGIKGRNGVSAVILKMVTSMISVLLCTFIASLLLNFFFAQLSSISVLWQGIIGGAVSLLVIVGGFLILNLVLGAGAIAAVLYVLVKIVLLNVLKVLTTYLMVLLVLLFIENGAYLQLIPLFSGWIGIIVLLTAADFMYSSIFD